MNWSQLIECVSSVSLYCLSANNIYIYIAAIQYARNLKILTLSGTPFIPIFIGVVSFLKCRHSFFNKTGHIPGM